MIFHGSHSEQYITGRELGRGGEGTVYELQNDGSRVLKQYNEPLSPLQIQKLQTMVGMRNPAIEAYAAWPSALVADDKGTVCGFIMKKLTGFVPLHMIFSPLDRKKMFPDKGYNFLVHVARNLATAFHKLHEAGLVVGDVNEGNILINANGLVSFIDCDSFQVKNETGYFFCEVGVPRYTPPELLARQSFDNVVRTTNTDSFSLAILIFQLLFLGRHPFAGRNKSAMDIDEETAIKLHEFAYSLTSRKKKLFPPFDSFDINNLTQPLMDAFHKAFETESRPVPAEWIKALDGLLTEMTTCSVSRIHSYPAKMAECPWCAFRKAKGIMYFLDDTYLQADALLYDIEQFVNGFRIDKMELKNWSGSMFDASVTANSISAEWHKERAKALLVAVVYVILSLVCFVVVHPLSILAGGALLLAWMHSGPVAKKVKLEKQRLLNNYEQIHGQMNKLIAAYNDSPDKELYLIGVNKLMKSVERFRALPDEGERLRREMEELIYNDNLQMYLRQFDINSHAIASIGQTRKTILLNAGIMTAADVSINLQKLVGIGPKTIQILLDWQRQMSLGFVYIPDTAKLAMGMQQVAADVATMKRDLERTIRQDYQSLSYHKLNVTNRALVLDRQIKDAVTQNTQAKLDMQSFSRFSRFI
ncbi:hypothetical protein CJD36_002850 [Flavipsychrobacter stenotrophus]|uniref:Protein kinase domain-containing protein n=1 Tax=Flavipsychrobacter stenotrophus TaxID=2077091 RepID=A0A2S7T0H8_9BACT|nr:protein kinase [Flavipsychrobacter stenotrophus]PQJ12700.1 hypothetical protein CJD36_002850 [Flavipsychrobacter stenotrophus]